MSEGLQRTTHAQQAFEFADLFAYNFGRDVFGNRRLKLMEPDGPSTAGGRQARQSLVLIADDDGSSSSIVCGWIDAAQRKAEIRTHRFVAEQFEARHRRSMDLRKDEYEQFQAKLEKFLRMQRIDFKVVEPAPIPRAQAVEVEVGHGAGPLALVAMLFLGILIGAGAMFLVLGV